VCTSKGINPETKTKNMTSNEISIADINSGGIAHEARKAGITTITQLGDNGKSGDARVTVYQLGDVRVANTNGDPVWEESDHAAFAELLETEGIKL
jgi:hypothetical protein